MTKEAALEGWFPLAIRDELFYHNSSVTVFMNILMWLKS
jgi:hypothetical protein